MKSLIITFILFLIFSVALSDEIEECSWNNSKGVPCLTIFSASNTSKITEKIKLIKKNVEKICD